MPGETETTTKPGLLGLLAEELQALGSQRQFVGIDGVDGSGKTTFAEGLAAAIRGRPVLTIHVDDFLNLQEVRHRRGRTSPEGFWLDTYDYAALEEYVLTPLRPGGDGLYRPAATDLKHNTRLHPELAEAPDNAIVLVEGMFLHRDELLGIWDYSIFLDVPFTETARRMSIRDGGNPDPEHPSMRRYVGGQRLYFEQARPWTRATRVIDNTHPGQPTLLSPEEAAKRHS
ncbi:uridine kinase [Paenarthrobacter sp. JL.01a]|uniref:uridine kinase n=1 Tax=Paenarthrobacter sp. JL.01a TaxID=2979324 RepID=UPI0021C6E02D|nr:uridine kinase [Paenarthrobacter sp. JL.01a]UXM92872.1 uridine kinase [Paenarthrobacter sp. JL.01a]